ncbi:hypothetical protein ACPA9J_27075 [Pseudomonas aeruginosa]
MIVYLSPAGYLAVTSVGADQFGGCCARGVAMVAGASARYLLACWCERRRSAGAWPYSSAARGRRPCRRWRRCSDQGEPGTRGRRRRRPHWLVTGADDAWCCRHAACRGCEEAVGHAVRWLPPSRRASQRSIIPPSLRAIGETAPVARGRRSQASGRATLRAGAGHRRTAPMALCHTGRGIA